MFCVFQKKQQRECSDSEWLCYQCRLTWGLMAPRFFYLLLLLSLTSALQGQFTICSAVNSRRFYFQIISFLIFLNSILFTQIFHVINAALNSQSWKEMLFSYVVVIYNHRLNISRSQLFEYHCCQFFFYPWQ